MNKLFPLLLPLFLASCMGTHKSDAETANVSPTATAVNPVAGDTVGIDILRSRILWKGTKMEGSGKHEGEIKLEDGYLIMSNGNLSAGKFTIDMQSITVSDIPAHEPVPRERLTTHLKSADFFNADKYPFSQLEITTVERLPSDSLLLHGNLRIKDVEKNIEFKAMQRGNLFSAKFTFDRFLWNIAYEGSWADKTLVDKDIELAIMLKTE